MTSFNNEKNNQERQEKLEAARHYHRGLIQQLDISPGDFQIKNIFRDSKGREVVCIYPSEFKRDKGCFFELVTSMNNPIDQDRKVYRVPPNSCFDEEYEMTPKGSFMVPLEEVRCVYPSFAVTDQPLYVEAKTKFKPETFKTETKEVTVNVSSHEDAPYSEMTIRDFYAIHTGKPVSTKSWLNNLIKSNN